MIAPHPADRLADHEAAVAAVTAFLRARLGLNEVGVVAQVPDWVGHVRPLGEPPRTAEFPGEQIDGQIPEFGQMVRGRPENPSALAGGPLVPHACVEAGPGGSDRRLEVVRAGQCARA